MKTKPILKGPVGNKYYYFKDYMDFKPNISPRDVFYLGSFGGTYFRPIHSSVTDKDYKNGEEFIHNGRLHRRTRIGKSIFDHDISSKRTTEMVDEFVAGSKLSNKEYNEKYGV